MKVGQLAVGVVVRIKRTFLDFDRRTVEAGQTFTLRRHDFFPHDGGHTLAFDDGTVIRLAEIDPASSLLLDDAADLYWELVDPPPDA